MLVLIVSGIHVIPAYAADVCSKEMIEDIYLKAWNGDAAALAKLDQIVRRDNYSKQWGGLVKVAPATSSRQNLLIDMQASRNLENGAAISPNRLQGFKELTVALDTSYGAAKSGYEKIGAECHVWWKAWGKLDRIDKAQEREVPSNDPFLGKTVLTFDGNDRIVTETVTVFNDAKIVKDYLGY